jgi:chemotaxis protein methyltransferase WspC
VLPRPAPAARASSAAPFAAARSVTAPPRPAKGRRAAGLETAQRLADEGRFAEAAITCEAHIRENGPSAPAFYLLGLVHDAGDSPQAAETCYRKALYLNPAHAEAAAHLALMLEMQGRAGEAQLLRKRAQRLAPKTTTSL